MISKKSIDEIFLTAKIEEVVGDFVSLKKRGQNWVGVCPFHDDRNPSMYVNPRLGIFKCFVCDAGGNAVHFLMEHEKISYPEALRYLAKKYNIVIEEDEDKSLEEIAEQNEKEALFILNEYAEKYFTRQLFDSEEGHSIGLSYFKERGFKESTIRHFRLGYCPEGWDYFTQDALKNSYNLDQLLKLGLTKKSESGKLFDFYRGRVIFPIHNAIGKTVGFGGRILKKEEKIAKYFNSPESEIYHKSDVLYGFFFAKKAIRSKDNVYLVEGYTDVISMFEAGVENVVASSGTALTEGQIKILSSQTRNITVLYDGDAAGIKASLRGIDMLLEKGLNVQVVLLPDGEDPDSFAKKHRDTELMEFLTKNATNFLIFKAKILSKEAGSDPVKRAEMVNEMIRTIAEVSDQIARAFYIKECAELFNLSEEILNTQLRKVVWKKMHQSPHQPDPAIDQKMVVSLKQAPSAGNELNHIHHIEKSIILLILKYGIYEIDVETTNTEGKSSFSKIRIDQYIFNEFDEEEIQFTTPIYQKIYEEYAYIASRTHHQDEIKKYFSLHEDKAIQDFVIPYLLNSDPEYSPDWERRFDMYTKSVSNNIQQLNNEVMSHILMFKIRIIEQYRELIIKELQEKHSDETVNNMMIKYDLLIKRRAELAKLLGVVVSR
ncbi:MAG: DNA primase [Bacteroidales bacterium]